MCLVSPVHTAAWQIPVRSREQPAPAPLKDSCINISATARYFSQSSWAAGSVKESGSQLLTPTTNGWFACDGEWLVLFLPCPALRALRKNKMKAIRDVVHLGSSRSCVSLMRSSLWFTSGAPTEPTTTTNRPKATAGTDHQSIASPRLPFLRCAFARSLARCEIFPRTADRNAPMGRDMCEYVVCTKKLLSRRSWFHLFRSLIAATPACYHWRARWGARRSSFSPLGRLFTPTALDQRDSEMANGARVAGKQNGSHSTGTPLRWICEAGLCVLL